MKIVTVIGARPQFIKAASVSAELNRAIGANEILIHTGQHFDKNMSQVFFDELEIPVPTYNLGISGGLHGTQTGRMLEGIESVLVEEKPDIVLVYGDTNSTLAGALAAAKLHIPLAHVEAGLRSFNKRMPEEINRLMTDHLSDLLFVPTKSGLVNLVREGVDESKILMVGDVMYDVALFFSEKATLSSNILQDLKVEAKSYVLSTIHRAENTENIELLCSILSGLAKVAEDMPVILPLHPRTRNIIYSNSGLSAFANELRIIEPVGYLDMIMLENNASLIATDSGGVQKEAFFCKVPCITLRNETEWIELVDLGWNHLAPPAYGGEYIASTIHSRLNVFGSEAMPYGDGHASRRIVSALSNLI